VITLLPIFPMLALLPDKTLYIVPTPWRWLMVGGQVLALVGGGVALWQSTPFHFLGLAQLFAEQPAENRTFEVQGFYAWVRHPLYFFSLLFLWLTPLMSVNLLTTYILFTIYFFIGSIHEERRLLAEFGAAYRDYQRRVPPLIPIPGRRYKL
jgi:protein-S-isoprenylcysteine O-methyltransferase Ste14